ncbi:hypothetical protein J8I87_37180 [Paraburkholderia sp. LEh10]|uniref:hypothetical protein n=1 Tax=Paraburkholderia sp. LEh10 TaxID=2821353 RepID=UPI001AE9B41F|nr:hypothetical protein [Paraburkholderia sp. LEh10]MBP0595195.1 hypothetical protein [Paraburkholderia sp. LEh10]
MSALMINDLPVAEELGSNAMKAVRGGFTDLPSFFSGLNLDFDSSLHVTAPQVVNQAMTIYNMSGGNTNIVPTMSANNVMSVR